MANTTMKDPAGLVVELQAPGAAAAPPNTAAMAMVIGSDSYRSALEPSDATTAWTLAGELVAAGMFGLKHPAEGLAKIMYGRSIGVGTMQALQRLHNIEGKIGVDAELLHALCLRSPLCEFFEPVLEECDETKAVFIAKRVGRPEKRNEYTIERAEQMGVIDRGKDEESKKKNNWRTQRRRMLMARCRSELAHMVFPDVANGLYTTDELQDMAADDNEPVGEVVTAPVVTVRAAPRDYPKEIAELKAKITAATTRQGLREVRDVIAKWDGPDHLKKDVGEAYEAHLKAVVGERPAEKPAAKPAPVPEGNLFGDQAGKGESKS